jgi:hypothetical protein
MRPRTSAAGTAEMSIRDKLKLGATGDYPRGKLRDDDEGGIRFAVIVRDKTVVLDFGQPVAWLGIPASDARALARAIMAAADRADPKKTL